MLHCIFLHTTYPTNSAGCTRNSLRLLTDYSTVTSGSHLLTSRNVFSYLFCLLRKPDLSREETSRQLPLPTNLTRTIPQSLNSTTVPSHLTSPLPLYLLLQHYLNTTVDPPHQHDYHQPIKSIPTHPLTHLRHHRPLRPQTLNNNGWA
jgi:hypothetical protein